MTTLEIDISSEEENTRSKMMKIVTIAIMLLAYFCIMYCADSCLDDPPAHIRDVVKTLSDIMVD
ncbi:hypothetical protein AC791_07785 [Klebsiella sp. RIT-PI-d]|nr:hypothetical protein AC791_07785 [Klebsiella sp. RIT-PI-d]